MSFPPRPSDPKSNTANSGGDDAQPKSEGVLGSFFNRLKTAALTPQNNVDVFFRMVKNGDVAGVRAQLATGMSANATNANGETAAHIAARADKAEVIAVLAQAGADLKRGLSDDPARTPLQDAINFGKTAAAAKLISCGGCPDNTQATQDLLHRACEKDMGEVILAFAAAGVDLRTPSALQVTPMMAALNAKKNGAAHSLLSQREVIADINARMPGDREGRTLFHLAVMRSDSALIDAMIADGALVNLARDDGMTPLLLAINRGDVSLVGVLLSKGADATRPVMAAGQSALKQLQAAPLSHLAAIRTMNDDVRAQIARLLIEAGADVNAVDVASGSSPLHRLMSASNVTATMSVFLRYGARVGVRNREGATPLMLAIEGASLHEITNLLSAGADPNARHDQDARTPLMIAAALGQTDTIRELLQAGANPRLLDNNGHSAMYWAQVNIRAREQTVPLLAEALRRDVKPLFRWHYGPGGRQP